MNLLSPISFIVSAVTEIFQILQSSPCTEGEASLHEKLIRKRERYQLKLFQETFFIVFVIVTANMHLSRSINELYSYQEVLR